MAVWAAAAYLASVLTCVMGALPQVARDQCLQAHNDARGHVNPPADPPLTPFLWSSDLEDLAQRHANTLISGNCVLQHSSFAFRSGVGGFSYIGENLGGGFGADWAATEHGCARTLKQFEDEHDFYVLKEDQGGCDPAHECRHYTQVVWADTTHVGCATVMCTVQGMENHVWVCEYGPGGNIKLPSGVYKPAYHIADSGTGVTAHPCDADHNPCAHGTCAEVGDPLEAKCTCTSGWAGDHCDKATSLDPLCVAKGCQNSAACEISGGVATCICPTGLEGDLCETDHDDCPKPPCTNHGVCVDERNGYHCDCIAGREGRDCEEIHLKLQPWQFTVVEEYNRVRVSVDPPAKEMYQVVWDPDLAKSALDHAQKCQRAAHSSFNTRSGLWGYTYVGENIFFSERTASAQTTPSESTIKAIVRFWEREKRNYNFTTDKCRLPVTEYQCEHYWHMVWWDTYAVGCAHHFCPSSGGAGYDQWVCHTAEGGGELHERPYTPSVGQSDADNPAPKPTFLAKHPDPKGIYAAYDQVLAESNRAAPSPGGPSPPSTTTEPPPSTSPPDDGGSGVGLGIGIAAGVLGVAAIAGLGFWIWKTKAAASAAQEVWDKEVPAEEDMEEVTVATEAGTTVY